MPRCMTEMPLIRSLPMSNAVGRLPLPNAASWNTDASMVMTPSTGPVQPVAELTPPSSSTRKYISMPLSGNFQHRAWNTLATSRREFWGTLRPTNSMVRSMTARKRWVSGEDFSVNAAAPNLRMARPG